jgi:predicted PurR-regulated permease PerM
MLNRLNFINKQSIRKKVSIFVAFILASVIIVLTGYSIVREQSRIFEQVQQQTEDLRE